MPIESYTQPLLVSDQTLELAYAANTAHTALRHATKAYESEILAHEISDIAMPDGLYRTLRAHKNVFQVMFDTKSYEAFTAIDAEWMQWQQCSVVETGSGRELGDPWKQLNPEQQKRATELATAMARKFGLDRCGFSVIRTESNGGTKFHVVYVENAGLYMGSWDHILSDNEQFLIEVGGQVIDTRDGMTKQVYAAFITGRKINCRTPLPDSSELEKWSWTWLTGEKAMAGQVDAPVMYTDKGKVITGSARINLADKFICFRPSVII